MDNLEIKIKNVEKPQKTVNIVVLGDFHQTEKAINVKGAWFPKSQIKMNFDDNETLISIDVPAWLFEKKNNQKDNYMHVHVEEDYLKFTEKAVYVHGVWLPLSQVKLNYCENELEDGTVLSTLTSIDMPRWLYEKNHESIRQGVSMML